MEQTPLIRKFWENGKISVDEGIVLRKVEECDKKRFLIVQRENAIFPSMFIDESFQNSLWREHIASNTLVCAVEVGGEYAGYCGIKDITRETWEISIDLLKKYTNKGIGYKAVSEMLDAIRNRLGVNEFRVRVAPDNYASQRLFEKLGAVPNGITEFLLHGEEEIERWEENNIHLIDEKIVEVAKKFNVEPRKLLSHVLEYKLILKGI